MAKKSFERQLIEWFKKSRLMVPKEAYDAYMTFLKKGYPDAFKEKKKGRPKAGNISGDNFIVNGCPLPDANDCSAIDMLLSLWGDTAKEWAKMALCLLDCGIIPSKTILKGKRNYRTFKNPIKAIYNVIARNKHFYEWHNGVVLIDDIDEDGEPYVKEMIETYKPKIVGYDMFARALKDMQENEVDYPQVERNNDKKRVMAILSEVENEIKNYIDQELAWVDGIDWYTELNK